MALSTLSRVQVMAQLVGVAIAIYPWPTLASGPPVALAACLAGAGLGIWALCHNRIGNFSIYPEPRHGARLVTSGPYARIRHPMYTALILMMAGIATWNPHPLNWAGAALVIFTVVGKALREERFLAKSFPDYEAYRRRTRGFIPFVV